MSSPTPHILLLVADQLAAPFLRAYGHPVTRTPVIDGLARDGVVFENAYTASPLCAPGRGALMTGRLPSETGAFDNGAEFPSSIPTFAHALRSAGYRTCLAGKMHFVGPDQLHGFEERLTTDVYPADYGWTPDWSRGGERIAWWYHTMSSVLEAGVAEATNQLDYDDEVGFLAVRRLFDHARYEPDVPLLLCVSFTHPHDPYVARRRHWDQYADGEIDAPRVSTRATDPHALRLRSVSAMDDVEITDADVLAARHGYYASLSYVDERMGEVLGALETCGLADDTVVLLTSDHGDFLGEHGLFYKMSFREHAARVPLIVHAPRRFAPRRVAAPVSLLDVAPTLVDLVAPGRADELPGSIDGRSLLHVLEGRAATSDGDALGEYLAEGVTAPMFMVRRGRWKLIRVATDPDQLFDLTEDPLELRNLADDPEHATTLAGLAAAVESRWDAAAIDTAVRRSQQERLAVFRGLRQGKPFPWDFQPLRDASTQYTRSTMDVEARDRSTRFPRVE